MSDLFPIFQVEKFHKQTVIVCYSSLSNKRADPLVKTATEIHRNPLIRDRPACYVGGNYPWDPDPQIDRN